MAPSRVEPGKCEIQGSREWWARPRPRGDVSMSWPGDRGVGPVIAGSVGAAMQHNPGSDEADKLISGWLPRAGRDHRTHRKTPRHHAWKWPRSSVDQREGCRDSYYEDPVIFERYTRHHDSYRVSPLGPSYVMEEPAVLAEVGGPTGRCMLGTITARHSVASSWPHQRGALILARAPGRNGRIPGFRCGVGSR
jgi:hypothetical protein